MAHRPGTLADIVAGHVSLEIEGFDRIYLNGRVPALQTSGQVAGWLHWRGFPIASPTTLGRSSQAFRAAVRRYAQDNGIPWMTFRKGDRKLDVIRPSLETAEKAGRRMRDSGNYTTTQLAALFNVSRPTAYRSLQRPTTPPPLPADIWPAPDGPGYDQLLTPGS